jgi:hypothetical protein
MLPWTTQIMTEQKVRDLQAEHSRAGRHYPAAYGGPQVPRAGRNARSWLRLSEWAGYKMIGVGCRLARPAVVARVQAEL